MSRAGELSPAAFLRAQGWGVGDILYGEPIYCAGKRIESPRLAIITAIGESSVLCRTQFAPAASWSSESTYDFNNRDWSLEARADTSALAEHDKQAAAKAWDECARSHALEWGYSGVPLLTILARNPYRASIEESEIES